MASPKMRAKEFRPKRSAILDFLRGKAEEFAEGTSGPPGGIWAEALNSVMAAGRSALGGSTYEDELTDIRAAREQQYPGAYSVIDELRNKARGEAWTDYTQNAPQELGMGMAAPIKHPKLSRALSTRSAHLLDDPPARIEDFVPMSEFRKRYLSNYLKDGKVIANSTTVPSSDTLPAGTWVIDDINGIHGREIGYVADVEPRTLDVSEVVPERIGDVERYAQWMREGKRPPPIDVVETDKGTYKVTEGHRRRRAALQASGTVPAIVWPTAPHPRGAVAYGESGPMRVALTWEILKALRGE